MAALAARPGSAPGQSAQEVQRKFTELRSDKIPHNGSTAMVWLHKRRDQLKEAMLDELYRSDRQGRDALLEVLFETPSFVPDDRFLRFVVARLQEEDKYVHNSDLDPELEGAFDGNGGAHHRAWIYIDHHFDRFEPLLADRIKADGDLWAFWATTWMFKKQKVLDKHRDLYTPEVLRWVASNMADDRIYLNGSFAVRTFLLLGDHGVPALQEASQARDAQESSFARAVLDALRGKRPAFGFLVARVDFTHPLIGLTPDAPDWLEQAGAPYFNNDRAYP